MALRDLLVGQASTYIYLQDEWYIIYGQSHRSPASGVGVYFIENCLRK